MPDLANFEPATFAAIDDLDHKLVGILLGEVTADDRPHCWMVLTNGPGWFETAAAVGTVILLNKAKWVPVK
jgi:hypothetical protein